jgi:predicted nucleic acid-binding protein
LALGFAILVTPFNRSELANAVYRQVFLKRLSLSEAQKVLENFRLDCASSLWNQSDFPQRAWGTSSELARRYGPALGVRTLDSLHVACALELKAERFWTYDQRQAQLAEAVGLKTSS